RHRWHCCTESCCGCEQYVCIAAETTAPRGCAIPVWEYRCRLCGRSFHFLPTPHATLHSHTHHHPDAGAHATRTTECEFRHCRPILSHQVLIWRCRNQDPHLYS